MLLRYWHILHLNCCTTTTSIMASRLCRSSSSVPEAGGGCARELGSPWGSSGGSRHVDVDVGPSARVSMAARLLVRVEVDIGDVMGAPEDRTENGRQDCLRVSAALPRQAQFPHEARAMANPLRSHGDLFCSHLLQGSMGVATEFIPSSGPCRIRYWVVSAPPSSALVTVMQPGKRR